MCYKFIKLNTTKSIEYKNNNFTFVPVPSE